jgi:hypothetical protein
MSSRTRARNRRKTCGCSDAMRAVVLTTIVVALMTNSPAIARGSHGHSKRAVSPHIQSTKTSAPVRTDRHPDDVALDRKIGSICRGC